MRDCDCAHCPYSKDGQPGTFLLPETTRNPAGFILLGSGPNAEAINRQQPLAGNVGREFVEALNEAGLKRERLLMMYAYACAPKEPRRDKEERAATNACRPAVRAVVATLDRQTPVLLAGKWALLSVIGRQKGLFKTRGFTDRKWTLEDMVSEELKNGKERMDDDSEVQQPDGDE